MSEKNDDNNTSTEPKKTLSLGGSGLSQGIVRQNFSHGRSKSVVVETRKRRIHKPGAAAPVIEDRSPAREEVAPPVVVERAPKPKAPVIEVLSNLSKSELEARRKALEAAKANETEDRLKAEADEARRAKEDVDRAEARKKREDDEAATAAAAAAEEAAEAERMKEASVNAAAAAADPDAPSKPATREEPKISQPTGLG